MKYIRLDSVPEIHETLHRLPPPPLSAVLGKLINHTLNHIDQLINIWSLGGLNLQAPPDNLANRVADLNIIGIGSCIRSFTLRAHAIRSLHSLLPLIRESPI